MQTGSRATARSSRVQDLRDGQVRLHLPDGFGYRSFNPAGEAFT
ncbi:hypothetical protein [Nonomuraea dietziae]